MEKEEGNFNCLPFNYSNEGYRLGRWLILVLAGMVAGLIFKVRSCSQRLRPFGKSAMLCLSIVRKWVRE